MSLQLCKNCGQPTANTYCSHCGQKITVPRISFHYVWHEVFHFFTHLEKGFLFTTFEMLRSPGTSILSFIDGKRKPYQPPVSYFLIWTTVFILTLYLLEQLFGENKVIDYNDYFGPGSTTQYAISHLSVMLTFIIPFQAAYLFVLVMRYRYNYFETLVAGIYAVGTIIVLQMVFAMLSLLYFLVTRSPVNLWYSDAFKAGYFIWFTISLLRHFKIRYKALRGILFILLAAGTFTAWRLLVVPQMVAVFLK